MKLKKEDAFKLCPFLREIWCCDSTCELVEWEREYFYYIPYYKKIPFQPQIDFKIYIVTKEDVIQVQQMEQREEDIITGETVLEAILGLDPDKVRYIIFDKFSDCYNDTWEKQNIIKLIQTPKNFKELVEKEG